MNAGQQKLRRLVSLTLLLLKSKRPLSAEEIRDQLDDEGYADDLSDAAFRRTFERDKSALLAMDVPIEVGKWEFGDPAVDHYWIDPNRYAELDLRFGPDELAALNLAAAHIRVQGPSRAQIKTGIANTGDAHQSAAESGEIVGELPFNETISGLASANAKKRSVRFEYRTARGQSSSRHVEPWRLAFTRGHWYLEGWDRHRQAQRLFRVDRITTPLTEGSKATMPTGSGRDLGDLKPWSYSDAPEVTARIKVDASHSAWAAHCAGVQPEVQPDGSSVLTMSVRDFDGLRGFVIGLLDHAEILEPAEFRDAMVDWLEAQR